jgi:hypothetical protein
MAALPAVALWRWRGSTTLAARTSSPAPAERRTSSTADAGASPATASVGATAAGRSSLRAPMDGLWTPAPSVGTPGSVADLLAGMRRVLSVEADAAEALGYEHGAAVLICLLADTLDAIDALGE